MTQASTPIITVENLCKYYPLYANKRDRMLEALDPFRRKRHTLHRALDNVSFTVNKGESLGIIGVNGSGKSTLLKILTGVLTPTSGRVTVNGRVAALLELGAGFHPERTGLENIYFMGALQGLSREEVKRHVPDVVEFADIGQYINQPVKTYSSGMFVRLAFAAAIQGHPDILIVDEALAVGDMAFQFKCISRMQKLIDRGTTIIFVSHAMDSIKRMCSTALYLHNGIMQAYGPAAEIAEQYLQDQRNIHSIALPAFDENAPTEQVYAKTNPLLEFKTDPTLDARTAPNRAGNGNVRFTCVEVIDEYGKNIQQADFDQKITVRLYLQFHTACATHVGYHIRNKLNESIIGCGTGFQVMPSIVGRIGDKYAVEFTTALPLKEGPYSITAVSSHTRGEHVIFHDCLTGAAFLLVNRRDPAKAYNAVQLPNSITINSFNEQ